MMRGQRGMHESVATTAKQSSRQKSWSFLTHRLATANWSALSASKSRSLEPSRSHRVKIDTCPRKAECGAITVFIVSTRRQPGRWPSPPTEPEPAGSIDRGQLFSMSAVWPSVSIHLQNASIPSGVKDEHDTSDDWCPCYGKNRVSLNQIDAQT
jgi:hypothetical protein